MNLFTDYQRKIFASLKSMEKKGIIIIPKNFKSFSVELPPKDQRADMSCNAPMMLAKSNKSAPIKIAEIIAVIRRKARKFINCPSLKLRNCIVSK